MSEIRVTDEALRDSVDLLGVIHRRRCNWLIACERRGLALIIGEQAAWVVYPPTADDDPAEYAQYWQRMVEQ